MAACSRVRRQHKHATNGATMPAESVSRDGWRQSHLDIQGPQCRFDRTQLRLDLYDQQSSRRCVPGDDVVSAPLAVLGKRDFHPHGPAQVREDFTDASHDARVDLVDDPVGRGAAIPCYDLQLGTQGGQAAIDLVESKPLDAVRFQKSDLPARHT